MTSSRRHAARFGVGACLAVVLGVCANGAISLAVLWRCDPSGGTWEMCQGIAERHDEWEVPWVAAFSDGVAMSSATVQWMLEESSDRHRDPRPADSAAARRAAERMVASQLDQPPYVMSPSTCDSAWSFVVSAGWPMRSVSMTSEAGASKGGVALPALKGWPSLRVLSTGTIVNSALFSTVLGVSLLGVSRLRRWRRKLQSRCLECGFPRGVSSTCTECGSVVPPPNPGSRHWPAA